MAATMDRLFSRKRSDSRTDETDRPATLKKQPSAAALNESFLKRRAEVSDTLSGMRKYSDRVRAGERGLGGVTDKAPSIDVDIRNSLILPGLSQRFSVLLPSLSTAPEDAIRSLLASQRATDGPSLTLEEEELLIAEMREKNEVVQDEEDSWDDHHPIYDRNWSSHSLASVASGNSPTQGGLSASASSPSVLSDSDAPTPASAPLDTPGTGPVSPPPTSNSFSSFQTFGAGDTSPVKIKSYGFSGSSGFRDADYIRRARKAQKSEDILGYREVPDMSAEETVVISAEDDHQAESSRSRRKLPRPPIPTEADSFAQEPAPVSPSLGVKQTRMRRSLLAGLTPSQAKRISMALGQIEEKLYKSDKPNDTLEEEPEETLQPADVVMDEEQRTHNRQPSDSFSEASTSTISSAFPYKASTAGSTPQTKMEPPSPSRLPPSPRTHDLHAHIARSETSPKAPPPQPIFRPKEASPVPVPILTPSRTQPVRHTPTSSLSNQAGQASSSPGYVPGQPRPVRSAHRSTDSVSSRADTPSRLPAQFSRASPSISSGQNNDLSSPPGVAGSSAYANANLGRSLSVNQGEPRSRAIPGEFGGMHIRAQSLDTKLPVRRGSTSLGQSGPSETIEEEADGEESPVDPVLRVQDVSARRNVSDLHRQFSRSERRSVGVKRGQQVEDGEADLAGPPQEYLQNQPMGFDSPQDEEGSSGLSHNRFSTISMDSTFAAIPAEQDCDDLFAPQSVVNTSSTMPEDPQSACEMLRQISGIGSEELSTLQAKLVEKAKAERLALIEVNGNSPELPITPAFVPISHPPTLGPIVRHAFQNSITSHPSSNAPSPDMISGAFSPISTGSRNVSPSERATILTASRRAAPGPPPDANPSERPVVETRPQAQVDHKRSASKKVAPEDDPDIRRDFEARIAAATAALHRTPTVTAPLQRKNTKKGGALVISSPTLVSSSATLGGNTVGPTGSPIDPGVAKALEKSSGSGGKMSVRWRKLGFKRGPSITNNQDLQPPPASASSIQPNQLKEPIALRTQEQQAPPQSAPVAPPSAYRQTETNGSDLNSFRFPQRGTSSQVSRSESTKAPSTSDSQVSSGRPRRGRSDDKPHEAIPEDAADEASASTRDIPSGPQSKTPSQNDIAIANFIEAGRALGLNDEQLNDMLVAKGMRPQPRIASKLQPERNLSPVSHVDASEAVRPAEGKVSDAKRRAAPAVSPAPAQPGPPANVAPQTERKVSGPKALLRSLSRSKKSKADLKESAASSQIPPDPVRRDVVVRRTILVPPEMPVPNSLLQVASEIASPGRISPRQRQPSIKRKPINLTREDEALVHGSPPPGARKESNATTASVRSEVENPGLGFLLPGPPLGTPSKSSTGLSESDTHSLARSSANGSLYDLYRNDEGQETLASPVKGPALQANGKRQTQAVEITEYADGKLVWSLVDALRDEDEHDEIRFGTPNNGNIDHSRTESLDSRRESNAESDGDIFAGPTTLGAGTAGLAFRHRNRGPAVPRPPTDIYFTSSADVADLIDHLSTDLNSSRGRIDILPTQDGQARMIAPLSPVLAGPGQSPNAVSTESGQFEDAPSPQRHLPHPIVRPRPYPDGTLPQRQLFGQKGSEGKEGTMLDSKPKSTGPINSAGGGPGRTVEDRLQSLLDRLKETRARNA